MLRDAIKQALVTAMKAKDEKVTGTLRMVQATIKNKDIGPVWLPRPALPPKMP